ASVTGRDSSKAEAAVILVDTGPLVALADRRDDRHNAALGHLRLLVAADLAVCDAVIADACFPLPHPNQRRRLRAIVHDLRIRPVPVPDERAFRLTVFDWLATYETHEPAWGPPCLARLGGPGRAARG